jgi:hypothetical protein
VTAVAAVPRWIDKQERTSSLLLVGVMFPVTFEAAPFV